jgi:hypothetical protein
VENRGAFSTRGHKVTGERAALQVSARACFNIGDVLFEACLVQTVTLNQMLGQYLSGPLAKARILNRLDPVAHRDDDNQVVVFYPIGLTVLGSLCKICTDCICPARAV